MKVKGWDLAYFQSGEWQVVDERLKEMEHAHSLYCPGRRNLFASLHDCPYDRVRVLIVGQDPYPKPVHCTGHAFSVPGGLEPKDFPPSLVNIFKEYQSDLHYPAPKNGDLTQWVKQGVLLWNAFPSCQQGKPGSHHWDEWSYLTKEIVEKLNAKGHVVFVTLGGIARSALASFNISGSIHTSHPSPLGANHGFLGSRIFTRINSSLASLNQPTIDWSLS